VKASQWGKRQGNAEGSFLAAIEAAIKSCIEEDDRHMFLGGIARLLAVSALASCAGQAVVSGSQDAASEADSSALCNPPVGLCLNCNGKLVCNEPDAASESDSSALCNPPVGLCSNCNGKLVCNEPDAH